MNGTNCIVKLQREIRRNHQARYDHRLHAVLLVMRGMSCQEVGRLLGDSARALQYWVRRFEEQGLSGLHERDKPGRPSRLGAELMLDLEKILRGKPSEYGFDSEKWNAKFLSEYLAQNCGVSLSLRQCQRLLRQAGLGSSRLSVATATFAQYIMASVILQGVCG